jgi:hypothetical protein
MAKTTNSQKVIEAEANLQVAKMLEGITNLKSSLEAFDNNLRCSWNSKPEEKIEDIFKPILKLKELMLNVYNIKKNCTINENIKLVDNITRGIQLKAKYEMRIAELETALSVAQANNSVLRETINNYKKSFIELIDKLVEGKIDKELVEAFMIKHNSNVMEKSINYAITVMVNKMLNEKKCQTEENPF